jgi:hypothetical protein
VSALPGDLLKPRGLNPGAPSGHHLPKQPNPSAIPDAAMMIVISSFSGSQWQRCENIEFFGFR